MVGGTNARTERHILHTTRHGYVIIKRQSGAIDFFLPIGVVELLLSIFHHTQGFVGVRTFSIVGLHELYKLIPRHHLLHTALLVDRHTSVVAHLQLSTFAAFLGGDDDYTIRTTATIDSSCRSIFKHREALNVSRVYHREGVRKTLHTLVVHGQTVDNDQRIIRSIQRRTTTNADGCTSTRSTATCGNVHTGNFTLDHVLCIHHKTLILFIGLNGCHRTCHIVLLGNTITDDNSFTETIIRFFQYNIESLTFPFHFLTFVANIRNTEGLPHFNSFDGEITCFINGCTVSRTFHHY